MCDVLKCETPYMLGYKSKLQILPRGGWKSHTYYVVDVAFNVNNPIHRKIFYTGFIDIDGNPQGYNGFARFDREILYLLFQMHIILKLYVKLILKVKNKNSQNTK